MKRIVSLASLLLCFLLSNAQTEQLIGNWEASDKSLRGSIIEFNPDMTAIMNIEGKTLIIDEYIINNKTNPIQIELKTKLEGQPLSMYLLVQFVDGSNMKMEVFPPGSNRPSDFSDKALDTQLILRKVN